MTLSGISYSDKITRSGWMIGGGWEYGFTPNWSVKIEYNQAINIVKLGLNYRF